MDFRLETGLKLVIRTNSTNHLHQDKQNQVSTTRSRVVNDIQLHPDNSNCRGKLKLLRVVVVSSYKGFEEKIK